MVVARGPAPPGIVASDYDSGNDIGAHSYTEALLRSVLDPGAPGERAAFDVGQPVG